MRQRWLLRVASHPRHGGGHVARCAALASALRAAGAEPFVWLDRDSGDAGAPFWCAEIAVGEEPPAMDGWSGSLVDGYDLAADVRLLSRKAPPLVVIDDFLSPPPGAALVVNAALHLSGADVDGVPALLGPDYALVDRDFSAVPDRDRTAPVRDIVVMFGRLDRANVTGLVLEALADLGGDMRIAALVSTASPHLEAVRRTMWWLGERGRLVVDAPSSLRFLCEADIVIGAGGVSLMERLAAGVPSVTAIVAENQRHFVEGAVRLGATRASAADKTALGEAIHTLLVSPSSRAAMAAAARRLVDGRGPARVAKRMMHLATVRDDLLPGGREERA